ncbi:MAG: hypothetical protein LBI98_03140 [Endomicrobium sp.]|nr:hypothetical protein [Endomicrobium sp.]
MKKEILASIFMIVFSINAYCAKNFVKKRLYCSVLRKTAWNGSSITC